MIKLENRDTKESKGGCLLVLGLLALVGLVIFICAVVPMGWTTFFGVDTATIEGEGNAYDPIAAFDTVSAYAGTNAQLLSISAYYVRSDGTMDLYAEYFPRVTYEFYITVGLEAGNDVPLGAPNSTANADVLYQAVTVDVWHPYQTRSVTTSRSYSYMHLGMERDTNEPQARKPAEAIPAPTCSFAELWATAIEKNDAPSEAVATIEYDAEGYHFAISDTAIRMNFDFACKWKQD